MRKFLKLLAASVALIVFVSLIYLLPRFSATAEVFDTQVASQRKWNANYEQETVSSTIIHANLTSDGGYIAAGSICIQTWSNCDGIIIKYDSNDQIEWQLPWGGTGNDTFDDVIEVEDNGSIYYMAVGTFNGSITAGGSTITSINTKSSDIGLVKIDSRGEIVWQKSWGGADYEYVSRITLANEGDGIIINGGSTSAGIDASGTGEAIINPSWEVAVVVKFDYSGTVVWQKGYDECSPYFGSIVSNPSGGYIFSGGREPGFAYMLLIDDHGETINKITWGSGDLQFYDAYATEDEIVTVLSDRMANSWSGAYYLMRYTQEGSIISQIETSADYKSIEPVFDGATLTGYLVVGTNKIAKYDINSNVVFEHSYNASFVDAFPLADGSYLALGTFSETIPSSGEAEAVSTSLQYKDSVITRFSPEATYYDIEIKSLEPASEYPTSTISVTVAEGNLLEQPADPSEYAGWQFVGWYEKDENGNFLSEPFDFSSPITRDSTIYTKYERKKYEIPFLMVVYTDSNATTIEKVVEVDRQTVYLGDTVHLPAIDTEAYNLVDNLYTGGVLYNSWYRGKVINGENSYVINNMFNDRYYQDFAYNSNHTSQFDFLFIRTYRKSYTVHYEISDYDDNTYSNVCGEYSSEMSFYSSETVYHGEKISTVIRSSSPDNGCVLSGLKSSPSQYGTYTDFDPESPIESNLYIRGQYIENYLVIRNDTVYYADGTPLNLAEASGIEWAPESNTLTLDDYSGLHIQLENGEEPINVVINGENNAQIRSSSTPIIISGDGTLASIQSDGTSSVLIESGTISDGIKANNMIVNGGVINSEITICQNNYESSCTLIINGGKIEDAYSISADSGSSSDLIIYDGVINNSSIQGFDNITIEGGSINPDERDIRADRIVMNGGSITGLLDSVEAHALTINGGSIDVVTDDGFEIENLFVLNDGVFNVKSMSMSMENPPLYVDSGYAVFNGGTANISGLSPTVINYPGSVEELISSEVDRINVTTVCSDDFETFSEASYNAGFGAFENEEDCVANLPGNLPMVLLNILESSLGSGLPTHGGGLEINGGDVTFNIIDKEEYRNNLIEAYMSALEEDMGIPSTDEEVARTCSEGMGEEADYLFAHYKTWRIDIGDGTLEPMLDGEGNPVMLPDVDMNTGSFVVDEEGNPIFIPLYNLLDGEGNIINNKIGQAEDENGSIFYFKAGYSDVEDCINNFMETGPEIMKAYMYDYASTIAEQYMDHAVPYPTPVVVARADESDTIDTTAIYVNEELFRDPEDVIVAVGTVSLNGVSRSFATLGDGKNEGDPSITMVQDGNTGMVSFISENTITFAHFFDTLPPVPPVPNTDGGGGATDVDKGIGAGDEGVLYIGNSAAVAGSISVVSVICIAGAAFILHKKLSKTK